MRNILEGIRNFFVQIFDGLTKFVAKLYNSLHPKIKIALMVFTSFIASGFVNLLIRDLTDYGTGLTNDYLKLIIDALLPLLTVVFNVLQQINVEQGTKLLVEEGDKKTIAKLHTKLEDTKKLLV